MASLLACCASEAACCFTSTACRCFCKSLGCGIGRSSTATRVSYALMFLVTAVASWVMLTDWAIKHLESITHGYLQITCPTGDCYGILAVYRICFASFLFHLLLSFFLYDIKSSRDQRAGIQNGFWGVKFVTWIGFTAGAFFIPNEFFIGWATYFAMWAAGIFVLIQVILLIDFAYNFSENLLGKWEDTENNKYLIILAGTTFAFYSTAIALTGILYAWFGPAECQLNQFFITFNLLLCVFMSIISILPKIQETNPTSGLGQAAITSLYSTYLVASAITSEPADAGTCNPLIHNENTQTTTMILGAIFTFVALAYSTSRAATQGHMLQGSDESSYLPVTDQPRHLRDAVNAGALSSSALDDDDDDEEEDGKYARDDESEGTQYSYCVFHVVFSLAACYLAMLLTNWNTLKELDSDSDESWVVGRSMAAVWVKIVSSWVVLLLYGWTLVAPAIFENWYD